MQFFFLFKSLMYHCKLLSETCKSGKCWSEMYMQSNAWLKYGYFYGLLQILYQNSAARANIKTKSM